MKGALLVALGVVLAFAGLWGGAYALHLVYGTWAGFPAYMTAMFVFMAGFALVGVGFHCLTRRVK